MGQKTKHDNLDVLSAFVVFENIQEKDKFIKEYYQVKGIPLFALCCKRKIPENMLF